MRYYVVSLSWERTRDGDKAERPVGVADLQVPVKAEDADEAIRKATSVCGYSEPHYRLMKVEAIRDRGAESNARMLERLAAKAEADAAAMNWDQYLGARDGP